MACFEGASHQPTTQAQRPGASILRSRATAEDGRNAMIASTCAKATADKTATLSPGSLQRMVRPHAWDCHLPPPPAQAVTAREWPARAICDGGRKAQT